MKIPPLARAALALVLLHGFGSASAATRSLSVSTTLRPSSQPDDAAPSVALTGDLAYDADATTGSGSFRIADEVGEYKGSAWVTDAGLLFDGRSDNDASLYVNLSTDPGGTGSVIACKPSGPCAFYTSLGGAVSPGKP